MNRLLGGEVETALLRSDWDDPEALFVGVKAGTNQAHHGHLSRKGKQLTARVLSPAGAAFTVESAEQFPPQKRNEGVSRLVIRLPETKGPLTIAVLLSPQWKDGVSVKNVAVKPLKEW